jgi:hypothetical protein
LASLIVAPTPGTNGSIIAPAASTAPGITNDRHRWYGSASAASMPQRPSPAQTSCRLNVAYGDSVPPTELADVADSTITRPSITKPAMMTTIA